MDKKLILAAPCLALLAACGGSGTSVSTPPPVTITENAAAGSVTLEAGQTAIAPTLAEALAVDLENSAPGSIISVEGGVLAGAQLKVQEQIAGNSTVLLTGTEGGDDGDYELIASENLNAFITAALLTAETDWSPDDVISSSEYNGQNIYTASTEKEVGTTRRFQFFSTIFTDDDTSLTASADDVEIAGENVLSAQIQRNSDSAFSSPLGSYSYNGTTDLFIDNNGDSSLYRAINADITVNFDDGQGTYNADSFQAFDPSAPSRAVDIESSFTVDLANGTLSGSSGTAEIDGQSVTISTEGAFDSNASAVAGFILPNNRDSDLDGGIFVMTKQP